MKIAIDCRMLGMSGIGVYFDHILSYILAHNTKNSFILIGHQSKLQSYKQYTQCQILNTDIPIISLREIFCFPTKEINKCDVFYSPNYNIPFGIKIPIYASIFDVVYCDVDGLISKLGRFVNRMMLWRALKISKTIFTVSNFSKERIQFHFKTNKSIIVAYAGIRHELQNYKVTQTTPYNFPYILYVGNIKKHKGISILLKAFQQACKNGLIPKLVIVGDFENFRTKDDAVIKMINKQNDDIIFTGKISDYDLYNTMAHAALLIQPSIYEGFGMPPLEALYLGINVLISDIPVFREIYGELPVTFFNINRIEDLKEKMTRSLNICPPNPEIKTNINNAYNMDKSAQLILSELEKTS